MSLELQPQVSVVIETSDWYPEYRVQLWDTLNALSGQTYPGKLREVLVVLRHEHRERSPEIAVRYPEVRIEFAPPGLEDYELKNLGAQQASHDLILFTNANCVPAEGWLEQAVLEFASGGEEVAAVQGRTQFLPSPLSRLWDAIWWARAFADKGSLDRLYTDNNLAFRRKVFLDHPFDPAWPLRTGFERFLSEGLRRAGYEIRINPRMEVYYNYAPTLDVWRKIAVDRGYFFLATRRSSPHRIDRLVIASGWLAPFLFPLLIWARDLVRVLRRWRRVGLTWSELWKYPLYALGLLLHTVGVAVGMAKALAGHAPPPRPS